RFHRQLNVAVASRSLRRAWRDAALAQQRYKRMPKCVNVNRLTTLVALWDAGRFQVAIENPHQPVRHVENWRARWQRTRNGLTGTHRRVLLSLQLLGDPIG